MDTTTSLGGLLSMAVDSVHDQYSEFLPDWQLVRSAKSGERAIKAATTTYLPQPSGFDAAQAEAVSENRPGPYDAYIARSQFPDWVAEALRTMLGVAFDKPAQVELPRTLEPLIEKATWMGESLDVFAKRVVSEVLQTGRYGVLCDVARLGTPYLAGYVAESITNWRTNQMNNEGLAVLDLVVLMDSYNVVGTDPFKPSQETQYRALWYENNTYRSDLWRKPASGGVYELVESNTPRTSRNNAYSWIPFIIAGSTDVHPDCDEIPIIAMVRSALKHYQLSADYYHSLYMTANPTPVISGMDADEASHAGTHTIGSTAIWHLPHESAKAYYLEVSGNGIGAIRQAMQDAHQQALEAGAKIIDTENAESGTAKRARQRDAQATLRSVVQSSGKAIEHALKYHAMIAGENPESVVYKPSLEFDGAEIDAQLMTALNTAVVSRVAPKTVFWDYMRRAKLTDKPDDEIAELIENDDSDGLNNET